MRASVTERIIAILAVLGLQALSAKATSVGLMPGPAKLRTVPSQNMVAFPESFFDEYDGFEDAEEQLDK